MSFHDMGFWIQSARTDARLAKLKKQYCLTEAFDQLYSETPDPWGFMNPRYRYQRLKYSKIIAILPEQRFRNVLDVGCGIGVFTRMLSTRADKTTGMELSSVAVNVAEKLSLDFPLISYMQGELEATLPSFETCFDLVVLADVLYYLSPLSDARLEEIIAMAVKATTPGGLILLANHYFGRMDAGSRLVRTIHNALQSHPELILMEEKQHPFFLVSLYQKA